ncbi:MAG: hypothetical protein KJ559_00755 [Nanoarchaeota archaeon]|nr:hypothetical protein [Nanoarchaeota archaeon]
MKATDILFWLFIQKFLKTTAFRQWTIALQLSEFLSPKIPNKPHHLRCGKHQNFLIIILIGLGVYIFMSEMLEINHPPKWVVAFLSIQKFQTIHRNFLIRGL